MNKKFLRIISFLFLLTFSFFSVVIIVTLIQIRNDPLNANSSSLEVQFKEKEIIHRKLIPQNGGRVGDSKISSLENVLLEIPTNAVRNEEEIKIGFAEVSIVNERKGLDIIGDAIILEKSRDSNFTEPVSVTTYVGKDILTSSTVGIFEYTDDDQLIPTTITELDKENGTITFRTTHFSRYLRIGMTNEEIDKIQQKGIDTGFKPSEDGWFIHNWGSFRSVGNCLGMASYANYNFQNENRITWGDYLGKVFLFGRIYEAGKRTTEELMLKYSDNYRPNNFYNKYRTGLLDREFDDEIAQQLAGRIDDKLVGRWSRLTSEQIFPMGKSVEAILEYYPRLIFLNIYASGLPQLIYAKERTDILDREGNAIRYNFTENSSHAVLFYKYEKGKFFIYDPNFPYKKDAATENNVRTVSYDFNDGFGEYPRGLTSENSDLLFNTFIPLGENFFISRDELEEFSKLAATNFPDTEYPEIVVERRDFTNEKILIWGKVSGSKDYNDISEGKYIHVYWQDDGHMKHERFEIKGNKFYLSVRIGEKVDSVHLVAGGARERTRWAGYKRIKIEKDEFSKEKKYFEPNIGNVDDEGSCGYGGYSDNICEYVKSESYREIIDKLESYDYEVPDREKYLAYTKSYLLACKDGTISELEADRLCTLYKDVVTKK